MNCERQEVGNAARRVVNVGDDDVQALASAATFKDFMGRGVPEFAATLAFVDVHLINVTGSDGESTREIWEVGFQAVQTLDLYSCESMRRVLAVRRALQWT